MLKPNRLLASFRLLLITGLVTLSVSAVGAKKTAQLNGPLDCVINPSVVADLGTGVPGILASVNVDRSDFVKAGDVIAELESGVETAALELARTRAALTAEVDLRRVNAAFGQRQNRRTKDLFKRKAISTNDMDQRETEARLGHIQLRQAEDNQALAQLEMLRAREILKRRTIKSPIDGVVMDRFKVIGEYVEDQPVVRVAQIDPLHVEVIVPVDRLGMIENGMYAKVWSESLDGETWQARVSRVDRIADVASGTYGVRLVMPNPDQRIPAGLRCRMQLVDSPSVPVEEVAAAARSRSPANDAVQLVERPDEKVTVVDGRSTPPREPVSLADSKVNPDTTKAKVEPGIRKPGEPVVVEAATTEKPRKAMPAGFMAIRRGPIGEDVAPGPAPVSSKSTVPGKDTTTVENTVVRSAADPDVAAIIPDPDQLAADLMDAEDTVVEIEPVTAIQECRLAGPYRDEVKATKKVVALRRAGLFVDIKSVASPKSPRYMIATPVLRDRAEANAMVARLKAAGITDFYLPHRSSKPLRISLGLYNGPKIAKQQIGKLKKMGFEAELLPWKQRGSEYYLVIRDVPAGAHRELLADLPVPSDDTVVTRGFCNQVAAR